MRKMRKWISILAAVLSAALPMFFTPITSIAKTVEDNSGTWRYQKFNKEWVTTDMPVRVTVGCADEEADLDLQTIGEYYDYDELYDQLTEEDKKSDSEFAKIIMNSRGEVGYLSEIWDNNNNTMDTVTLKLPFSGTLLEATCVVEEWEVVQQTPDSITFKFQKSYDEFVGDYCFFFLRYKKTSPDDMYWFKPMKTQMNIAAEIADQTGKEAVAEATGDFALSYDIMKWLEDHPNVTLKYTLTYKEKDYNIVIKGGQKLADPSIPWYGPEYLIGKFAK